MNKIISTGAPKKIRYSVALSVSVIHLFYFLVSTSPETSKRKTWYRGAESHNSQLFEQFKFVTHERNKAKLREEHFEQL